jgi:hypothetical protein
MGSSRFCIQKLSSLGAIDDSLGKANVNLESVATPGPTSQPSESTR